MGRCASAASRSRSSAIRRSRPTARPRRWARARCCSACTSSSGALGVDRASDVAGLRSVVGLGRMLAHEIKNPLAGIRGAAQLLKSGAQAADAPLAQLIMDETDRVRRLVDRMEAFSDDAPPERSCGEHPPGARPRPGAGRQRRRRGPGAEGELRSVAAAGLGRGGPADPDLPQPGEERRRGRPQPPRRPRRGADHHRLPPWRRVRAGDGKAAQGAPLEVRVQDNGPGVPPHLRDHLFEPFVIFEGRTASASALPWSPSWSPATAA